MFAGVFYNVRTQIGSVVSGALNFLRSSVQYIYETLVLDRLYSVYRNGPALNGWGFWAGQADESVCASLTKYKANFWKDHHKECSEVIQQHFNSFRILVEGGLICWLLYHILASFSMWLLVYKPLSRNLERLLSKQKEKSVP